MNIDPAGLESSLRKLTSAEPDTDLVRTLATISRACLALFGVDGCGVMIVDEQNTLREIAASDPDGHALERAELQTQQGPCTDAYIANRLVATTDLRTDPRWPKLATTVYDKPIRAVMGIPIRLGGGPVGTLDVLRHQPHHWTDSERAALQRYGDVIETALAAALAAHSSSDLASQLQYALDSRILLERSIGFLMASHDLDPLDAFNLLRRTARTSRCRIGAVAEELLRTGHLPTETDPPTP
ncbi:MAG TPA: GAF and ANTAR domain-containing protein [Microlunatus sp.]|nr:GAF and ANTAR domain-containing protein [Microlunatus sp.]